MPTSLPLVRATLISLALALALAGGCGSQDPTGSAAGPGSTPPGQPCTEAAECGCWQCTCQGVSGAPGGAQLCTGGVCPTGQDVCTTVCMISKAKVVAAAAADTCPGVP